MLAALKNNAQFECQFNFLLSWGFHSKLKQEEKNIVSESISIMRINKEINKYIKRNEIDLDKKIMIF